MNLKAYHISPKNNRESILKNGLIPAKKDFGRIQYGPSIFFSLSEQELGFDFVNFENVDCWEFEINSNCIKKDPFSGSSNHFFVTKPIHSIKLHSSY